ncbi:MAG: cyclic 2,3-diphosphoglycerate synthase [Bacillota bacterium]|nr:cyclic 2,3-diphosphoglycerate synthase [Bacillota bacterium]
MSAPPTRVIIMGAAGRDFHDFNTVFRDDPRYRVVAFTATQIPDIANRSYPPELAGSLYPEGIPIYAEEELPRLIREMEVAAVVFSYSDVSHLHVMHRASLVLAAGADFWLLGPHRTMLRAHRPVLAVVAARTGSGKSQTSRKLVALLRERGWRVVVVRHPMPYGDLRRQVCQRFASYRDLEEYRCTIEEREEYEPHLDRGAIVYAGADYARILRAAEEEADVILWDGGNNDLPFFRPDYVVCVVDPHRAGHEISYHPGETNVRLAQAVVINKVDTARPEDVLAVRNNVAAVNPGALIIEAASPVFATDPALVRGRRVLVVEDGPSVTHGEMPYGAGTVAARRWGAAELVDPRPYAVGSIREVYEKYPHLERVLPAMGYSPGQVRELEATINATPADVVIVATPIDLGRLITIDRPALRVRYELQEVGKPDLGDVVALFADVCLTSPVGQAAPGK